jgi:periplasmic divalent cation tolerance protein
MNDALVILTTVEQQEDGERLAERLVEEQLAACVQILPPMKAIYRWEGRVERAAEHLLLIKTTRASFEPLAAAIRRYHPYQTPEILAVPVETGSADYLTWLYESVRPR